MYPTYVFPYIPFVYVVVIISFVNPVTSFVVTVFVDVSPNFAVPTWALLPVWLVALFNPE